MMRKSVSVIFFFVFLATILQLQGQTKQISDLDKKRKATLREIENTNKLLIDTKKTTATLLSRIKLISNQISSRQNLVMILNQEINHITTEQRKTEQEIKKLEIDLARKQDNYATAIRGMARKKQTSNNLMFILSGKSFGESIRRMKYMREYSEWRNDQAEEIKTKKAELAEKKLALEKSKAEKSSLLAQRRKEETQLKKEEAEQQQHVTEAEKKQTALQAELKKKQRQANALNTQIEKLIAEEVARQEREAKRIAAEKAKASGKAPSTTPPTQTKEDLNLSNNFVANKGRFPMPVSGSSTIVARFGDKRDKRWQVTTNSAGIDIQARAGAEVRSIFQGEVTKVIVFPGYNNCIIIRHGGYYTFYGNIKELYVKQGQKVETGESIGKIFTDENGTSVTHFQLWKGTTKLNPEPWLHR